MAAPIRGPGKHLEGTLAIPGKTDEILGANMDTLANDLLHTFSEISESMGFIPGE